LDIQEIVQQVSQATLERLDQSGLSPEDIYECGQFIQDFTKIASTMLENEPGIPLGDTDAVLSMDEKMTRQALQLFSEGLYFSLVKCAKKGIKGELRGQIMQGLAMEIYNQAKQVVVATYGQENTPDFQFSQEQQVEMITKAANAHLVGYIADYEKQYGALEQDSMGSSSNFDALLEPEPLRTQPSETVDRAKQTDKIEEASHQSEAESEKGALTDSAAKIAIPTDPTEAPPPKTQQADTRSARNKYGAVALLLNKLSLSQQAHFMKQFSQEETSWIERYRNFDLITAELDILVVQQQLQQLQSILSSHEKQVQNRPEHKIKKLLNTTSPEAILSCMQAERPKIKQYLEQKYERLSKVQGKTDKMVIFSNSISEILYQHLEKRFPVQ
jgi:hypothetical protein